MRPFDHERMEVYRVALRFVRSASVIRGRLGTGRSALADQLDRASISIPLNIAEGAGELARREKARFYRIARRSATECAAILDIVSELRLAPQEQLREGREQLQMIVAMLVALGKRMDGVTEKAEAEAEAMARTGARARAGARAEAGAGDLHPKPEPQP